MDHEQLVAGFRYHHFFHHLYRHLYHHVENLHIIINNSLKLQLSMQFYFKLLFIAYLEIILGYLGIRVSHFKSLSDALHNSDIEDLLSIM